MNERVMNVIPPGGGAGAAVGPDHGWFEWRPMSTRERPAVSLPPLTFSAVVDLTAVEWELPGAEPVIRPTGGRGHAAYPDYPRMSQREYGHRAGIFRLLDVLEAAGISPTVILDAMTATHYPSLLERIQERVAEFVAGGLSASRPITSAMSEDEEQAYVGSTLEQLRAVLGRVPAGWMGPQWSESHRTPRVLAEHGIVYTMDWGNDEQPYPFTGSATGLWSYPLSWELSDLNNLVERAVPDTQYGAVLTEAADVLVADGATQPRVMGLHLHPWITGQPHMSDVLGDALSGITATAGVEVAAPLQLLDRLRR